MMRTFLRSLTHIATLGFITDLLLILIFDQKILKLYIEVLFILQYVCVNVYI